MNFILIFLKIFCYSVFFSDSVQNFYFQKKILLNASQITDVSPHLLLNKQLENQKNQLKYTSINLFSDLLFQQNQNNQLPIPPPLIEFKNQKKRKKAFKKINLQYTLPEDYLDQVIHRKKQKLYQCTVSHNVQPQEFLVELVISPFGQTTARLIHSLQKNQQVIRCQLNVLERIKFKKFSGPAIYKRYLFQFQKKGLKIPAGKKI